MKIGFIGLGKLGLPVALATEAKGHEVKGFDISPKIQDILTNKVLPYEEVGAQELLTNSKIELVTTKELVAWADIIFMAIQTPHTPEYEGTVRIPSTRADFDYSYVVSALTEVSTIAKELDKKTNIVLISTVLPGTTKRLFEPLLNEHVNFFYNPFFIAMGTVIPDFTNPEFVLLGNNRDTQPIKDFYATIHSKRIIEMPIVDAELTKVSYNTFIGMKIAFVNTLMEITDRVGGNVDNVTDALKSATDRLISPKYLTAGMGDGGGCHPRDNIAMSYLAKELGLSHNIFDDIMRARENQTDMMAQQLQAVTQHTSMPLVILGKAFKPETNIQTGSPAILLANLLTERGVSFTHLDREDAKVTEPSVFFIATAHEQFKSYPFPFMSVVVDPFGIIKEREGIAVIKIGRHGTR